MLNDYASNAPNRCRLTSSYRCERQSAQFFVYFKMAEVSCHEPERWKACKAQLDI